MGEKKGILFFVVFISCLASIIIFNSSFVSSDVDAEVSLNISTSTAIIVLRDNFNGATTDFTVGGNAALETLTGMTLERTGYGKVVFNEVVNITKDAYSPTGTLYDRVVDIDSNLVISRNFVSIIAQNLTSFNKSVTITLSQIGYDSPTILRNGIACPSGICQLVSFSGGVAVFNVSYFESSSTTNYSLAENETTTFCGDGTCNGGETCSTCPSDCGECEEEDGGGGGGGGGGGTIGGRNVTSNKSLFTINPSIISADIEKGKSYPQQVNISNTGTTDLRITVSPSSSISRFIQLDERSFVLKKGESKIYSFYVFSSTRIKSDLYTGRILFSSDKASSAYLDMAIIVQDFPVLFDIKINSLKEYVLPGRIASGEVRMVNIGDAESIDAVLEYGVMDFNNIIYASRTENITVTKSILSKKVSLKLPDKIDMGRYLIYSKLIYEDKIALSSDTFQVEQISTIILIIAFILILILIILTLLLILLVKRRKREKRLKAQRELEEKKKEKLREEYSKEPNLIKELLNEIKKPSKN